MDILTRGNPLAPKWRTAQFSPDFTPSGFCDQWATYDTTITIAAGTTSFASNNTLNNIIVIDNYSDFCWRALRIMSTPATGSLSYGEVMIRLRYGSGKWIIPDFVITHDIGGEGANTQTPVGEILPATWFKRGEKIYIDAQNSNAASVGMQVMFLGYREKRAA